MTEQLNWEVQSLEGLSKRMLSGLPLPFPQLGFRGLSIRIFKNSPGDFTTEKCWPILFLFYPVTSDSLDSTDCSTPGLLVPHHLHLGSLPRFMSTASVTPSGPLILWLPLLLPSIFPSIRDFSSESSVPIRQPKYWNLSFSISPSSEYSGLISLKTDWFDLLAVQGTFRSLLRHHSLKASVICPAAFVMVQLSQSYMTTGKTIALTIWTFVSRVMSLLFCIVHAQKLCRSCYFPDTSLALFSKCGSERNSISITWKCVLKTYPRLTECETQKVGFSNMYVAIPICTWCTAQFMKHCSGSFGGHSSVNGGGTRLPHS